MSRTNKDKPAKVKYPEFYDVTECLDKPKKPKSKNTQWHWLGSTPSWWNRLFHTRPKRRAGHIEEAVMKFIVPEDFDMLDKIETDVSRKPHKYFW